MGKTINQALDLSGKEKHHFIVYKIGNDRRPNRQKLGLSEGRAGKVRKYPKSEASMSPADKADRRKELPHWEPGERRKECDREGMS